MTGGYWTDIYVLANYRSAKFVYSFLNKFLPERHLSQSQWCFPEYSDETEFIIESEEEFLSYCEKHSNISHRSYWLNSLEKAEPRSAHVFFLQEGKIILGLSTDEESMEQQFFESLKAFANSNIGYITYECPPENTVEEFKKIAESHPTTA